MEAESRRVFGIDLGTTYSCIAYVNDVGKTEVVPNSDGALTTPSVVYFEDAENVVVGETAKEVLSTSPDKVISLVKRQMGEKDERTGEGILFEGVADEPLTPQEVSAYILRKLVEDAQQYTRQDEPITDVVITCPAYFGFAQREATKQAGELAGLNVRSVIPEPTAAAISYGMTADKSLNETVLVYDLGGGTFDATVIDIKGGEIEVVCVDGDHNLGGANWDEDVATWFAEQFSAEHGTKLGALMTSAETWQEFLSLAEKAKKSLTARTKCLTSLTHGTDRSRVELTREEFDRITALRLGLTIMATNNVLEHAREKGRDKIDKILLVGGSTYMPQVKERLSEEYPSIPDIRLLDPNQAVAKGAAMFGYKCYLDDEVIKKAGEQTGVDVDSTNELSEEVRERAEATVAAEEGLALDAMQRLTQKSICNVASKSFGLVTTDKASGERYVYNMIVVDAKVPATLTETFYTLEDGQTGLRIQLMENIVRQEGRVDIKNCTKIGEGLLEFGRPLPEGSPVETSFELSEDGLLSVHSKDQTTGREIDQEVKTEAILGREQIEAKKHRIGAISVT